jgi:integrase
MRGGKIEKVKDRWRCSYYVDGKRKYKSFKKRIDAEKFAKIEKIDDQIPISAQERVLIQQLRQAARRAGVDLLECSGDLIQTLDLKHRISPATRFCFEAYLDHCREIKLRPKTIQQYETYGMEFARHMDEKPVADITREEVLNWVLMRYQNDSSRGFVRTALVSCLKWAQDEKRWCYGWNEPLKWIRQKTDENEIAILTPKQFKILLSDLQPRHAVVFALLGFAGIRPLEVIPSTKGKSLKWNDIDFERRTIRIPGNISKVRSMRTLHDLPDNLWQWLELIPGDQRTGNVCPCSERNIRKLRTARLAQMGLNEWHQDVLRHSFGTYAYYYLGKDKTIDIMGHSIIKTFFKHYKANGSQKAAVDWFSISPS